MKVEPLNIQRYIRIVSTQISGHRVSKKFLDLTDDILTTVLKRLVESAILIKDNCKRKGLAARDIQAAVRTVIGGELSKHAVSEGTKAVTISQNNLDNKDKTTRAKKAKLHVSVSKVENCMRSMTKKGQRFDATALVYATAVVEYLSAEILEVSSNAANDAKRNTLLPKDFTTAMEADEELRNFLKCY